MKRPEIERRDDREWLMQSEMQHRHCRYTDRRPAIATATAVILKEGDKFAADELKPNSCFSSSRVHCVFSVSSDGQGTRLKLALCNVRQELG